MMWKELQTGGPRGLARWVGFLLTVIGGGFLVYYFVWYAMNAVWEMWEFGYQGTTPFNSTFRSQRWHLQSYLFFAVPMCYVLAILGVSGSGAAAITSEHEDDTWLSLTATDLTAREIIFAKLAGALARGRRFAEFILFMAITGAVAGSIHPLSIPLEAVALFIYGWFAAALGDLDIAQSEIDVVRPGSDALVPVPREHCGPGVLEPRFKVRLRGSGVAWVHSSRSWQAPPQHRLLCSAARIVLA